MYHTIVFGNNLWLDVVRSPNQPLERVKVARGTHCRAQIRPRVIETADGLFEVADLFFDDGTSVYGVPYASFSFAE